MKIELNLSEVQVAVQEYLKVHFQVLVLATAVNFKDYPMRAIVDSEEEEAKVSE